jgi:hypothetical protein
MARDKITRFRRSNPVAPRSDGRRLEWLQDHAATVTCVVAANSIGVWAVMVPVLPGNEMTFAGRGATLREAVDDAMHVRRSVRRGT